MILAQAIDPQIAWQIVLTVGVFSSLVLGWLNYARGGKPQIRNVAMIPGSVLEKDCVQRHDSVRTEITTVKDHVMRVDRDLQSFKEAVLANGEARKQHIIGVVDAVRKELTTQIDGVHRRVDKMQDELADIPIKTVALLRNTGQIGNTHSSN